MTAYNELPPSGAARSGKPITMGTVLGVVLRKYGTGKGRASRTEYWLFTLWSFIFQVAGAILYYFGIERIDSETSVTAVFLLGVFAFTWLVVAVVFFVPSYSIVVRRLHDSGKSAHYIWFMLIPVAGILFELVFMLQTPDRFTNKYGPFVY